MNNIETIPNFTQSKFDTPLYKFLDTKGAIKSLERCNIRFSKPEKFNDPFDCYEGLIGIEDSRKMKDKKALDYIISRGIKPDRISEVIAAANKFDFGGNLKEILTEYKKQVGVFSLSEGYTEEQSFLLWSYYAESHKGLCIEYNLPQKFYKKNNCYPLSVNYTEHFIPNSIDNNNNHESIFYWTLTKKKIWNHENEVRIIKLSTEFNNDGYFEPKVPPTALKKVVFGTNAEDDFIKEVIEILYTYENFTQIKFEKMEIDQQKHTLKPVKLKPDRYFNN
jgi:hypothetical protein